MGDFAGGGHGNINTSNSSEDDRLQTPYTSVNVRPLIDRFNAIASQGDSEESPFPSSIRPGGAVPPDRAEAPSLTSGHQAHPLNENSASMDEVDAPPIVFTPESSGLGYRSGSPIEVEEQLGFRGDVTNPALLTTPTFHHLPSGSTISSTSTSMPTPLPGHFDSNTSLGAYRGETATDSNPEQNAIDGPVPSTSTNVAMDVDTDCIQNTNSQQQTPAIDPLLLAGAVLPADVESTGSKRKRSNSSSNDGQRSLGREPGNNKEKVQESSSSSSEDAPAIVLSDPSKTPPIGEAAGTTLPRLIGSSGHAQSPPYAGFGFAHGPPPGFSELLTHLSRSISGVVKQAFEQGVSDGRMIASKDSAGRRRLRTEDKSSYKRTTSVREQNSGDGDSSDEDGSLSDSYPKLRNKQRRRTGERKDTVNLFYKVIRNFLVQNQVYPSKKGPKVLPECVSTAVLDRFDIEGKTAGPKVGDPSDPLRLNWVASLRHDAWNTAAINLLALRLQQHFPELKEEDRIRLKAFPKDAETLRKQIISRLTPIKTAVCKSASQLASDTLFARARMRRAARRKNRNALRKSIVDYQKEKRKHEETNVWDDTADVLHIMNGNGRNTADGASEDETEDEEGPNRKIVRVLGRAWINKAIPRLMHAVDTYAQDSLDDVGRQHQGNVSLERTYVSKNEDKRAFMTGLPRNFYDDNWYRSLDEAEKSLVGAQEQVVGIPVLVSTRRNAS